MAENSAKTTDVRIHSFVQADDFRPWVRVEVGAEMLALTPAQARDLALTLIDMAVTSEIESAAVRLFTVAVDATTHTDGEPIDPAAFLKLLTDFRRSYSPKVN